MDDKLMNKKIRWYRHVIRMSECRIQNRSLNMKLKRKCPCQKLRPRWKQEETCFTKVWKNMGGN
jgi:hypothetical protein